MLCGELCPREGVYYGRKWRGTEKGKKPNSKAFSSKPRLSGLSAELRREMTRGVGPNLKQDLGLQDSGAEAARCFQLPECDREPDWSSFLHSLLKRAVCAAMGSW